MLCPYCAEQIKDDAIKCKHCGEWLNKEPSSLMSITKGAVSSLIEAHDKVFGPNEIIDPKDDSPLIVDNLIL